MDRREFFHVRNEDKLIDKIIEEEYGLESVVIRKARTFALKLLMHPIVLDDSIALATNKLHITMSDSQYAEQLEREILHLTKRYSDKGQLFDDIVTAKEIGILQRWSGEHTSASIEMLLRKGGYQNRINVAYKLYKKEKDTKRYKKKRFSQSRTDSIACCSKTEDSLF